MIYKFCKHCRPDRECQAGWETKAQLVFTELSCEARGQAEAEFSRQLIGWLTGWVKTIKTFSDESVICQLMATDLPSVQSRSQQFRPNDIEIRYKITLSALSRPATQPSFCGSNFNIIPLNEEDIIRKYCMIGRPNYKPYTIFLVHWSEIKSQKGRQDFDWAQHWNLLVFVWSQ